MIQVEELSKVYDDLRRGSIVAVDRVSFEVKPGEIFGLLGPNGAGKTTVLRILSTVLKPTSGKAMVGGFLVTEDAESVRCRIGFVSNNTAIYDRMTAWELVEYFGRLNGMHGPALQQRLNTLFEQLQMNDFRDLSGAKMSTGMRQKVSIARALVHDPPILVFDEPTLGLDVLVARNLLEVIRDLKNAVSASFIQRISCAKLSGYAIASESCIAVEFSIKAPSLNSMQGMDTPTLKTSFSRC